jgi:hypothetical protein
MEPTKTYSVMPKGLVFACIDAPGAEFGEYGDHGKLWLSVDSARGGIV